MGDEFRLQAQGPGDIADGGAASEGVDIADHGRVFAAIAPVDVLDHLLPAVAGEVDVDVGHGVAVGGKKTVEEQVEAQGVDGRDIQQIGDEGVGGGTPALVADALLLREAHDVPDDEEETGQTRSFDYVQFVGQLFAGGGRQRLDFAMQSLLAEFVEVAEGRVALWRGEIGQAAVAEVQADLAALGDGHGVGNGVGAAGEEAGHLVRGFEIVLAVGAQQLSRLVQGCEMLDRDQDILQAMLPAPGVMHVVGGDQRQVETPGDVGQAPDQRWFVREQVSLQFDEEMAATKDSAQALGMDLSQLHLSCQQRSCERSLAAARKRNQALAVAVERVPGQPRWGFSGPERGVVCIGLVEASGMSPRYARVMRRERLA